MTDTREYGLLPIPTDLPPGEYRAKITREPDGSMRWKIITTHDAQERIYVPPPNEGTGVIRSQEDTAILQDLFHALENGWTYEQYILGMGQQARMIRRQRDFLRSLVDRAQYPEVDDWLWVEQQMDKA